MYTWQLSLPRFNAEQLIRYLIHIHWLTQFSHYTPTDAETHTRPKTDLLKKIVCYNSTDLEMHKVNYLCYTKISIFTHIRISFLARQSKLVYLMTQQVQRPTHQTKDQWVSWFRLLFTLCDRGTHSLLTHTPFNVHIQYKCSWATCRHMQMPGDSYT